MVWVLLMVAGVSSLGADGADSQSREQVMEETMRPYAGPSKRGVDRSTLLGKTVCGYQGWFNYDGDGAGRGIRHWTKGQGPLAPGNAKFDLWPDVTELAANERYSTGFVHADGRAAQVFSSYNRDTVLRHFNWMEEYGIDGAMVQRFVTSLADPKGLRHNNTVLAHCRAGANQFGRVYAVMYDLSGLKAGRMQEVIDDWKALRTRMHITEDPAYLYHRGKPLIAVWGVGFNDNRKYSLDECRQLVEFLKADGCAVMLGVPMGWRALNRDAVPDPALHKVLEMADVISPWMVGRVRSPAQVAKHAETVLHDDLQWCAGRKLDYLPVAFPGFSWRNMKGPDTPQIPRLKGEFFWSQFAAYKRAGASMLYVAMFDEVDEGTAIFKCINDVPRPAAPANNGPQSEFVTLEGLPSDFYLRLTGAGARMLRGEMPLQDTVPGR